MYIKPYPAKDRLYWWILEFQWRNKVFVKWNSMLYNLGHFLSMQIEKKIKKNFPDGMCYPGNTEISFDKEEL